MFLGTVGVLITLTLLLMEWVRSQDVKRENEGYEEARRWYSTLSNLEYIVECERKMFSFYSASSPLFDTMEDEVREVMQCIGHEEFTREEFADYIRKDPQRRQFLGHAYASREGVIASELFYTGLSYYDNNERVALACYRIVKRNLQKKGYNIRFHMVRCQDGSNKIFISDCNFCKGEFIIYKI